MVVYQRVKCVAMGLQFVLPDSTCVEFTASGPAALHLPEGSLKGPTNVARVNKTLTRQGEGEYFRILYVH